jgi:hypothetical protein
MSSEAEVRRKAKAMTRIEVLTRAVEGKIRWIDAAIILNLSGRQVRRLRRRFEELGVDYVADQRGGRPRKRRVPPATLSELLKLRREKYADFSVRHFYEHATEKYGLKLSYGTALAALQAAGLAQKNAGRGKYRRKRERRPMVGMMLHIDASTHEWIEGAGKFDLVAVLDDADGRLLYARFFAEEGTHSTLSALEFVLRKYGRFAELYHDRGSHYGARKHIEAQEAPSAVQRVCNVIGIRQIFSLSPEARGRSERYFGTLQGRLPQELKLHGIKTMQAANAFLQEHFIADMNRRFTVKAAQPGSAFVRLVGIDMDLLTSVRFERAVDKANGVHFLGTYLQLPERRGGGGYAKMHVVVHELLNQTLAVTVDGKCIARFDKDGQSLTTKRRKKAA